MSEELEKLTYKEALRLVIKILDEHGNQIKSIDERERLIQKALERLMGRLEGRKEESKAWMWKVGFALSIIGFAASVIVAMAT